LDDHGPVEVLREPAGFLRVLDFVSRMT